MSASPHRLRRSLVALFAAASVLAFAAPAGAEADVSHDSAWALGEFATGARATKFSVAVGLDDPAGGKAFKSFEVEATQSWCASGVLVERELAGSTTSWAGTHKPRQGQSTTLAYVTMKGPETRTPAGSKCATPDVSQATTKTVSIGSIVYADLRPAKGSSYLDYADEGEGGEFRYRDGSGEALLFLFEFGGWFNARTAGDAGSSWLWHGHWADATGVDVSEALPFA